MTINPTDKRIDSVDRRGKPVVYETRGTSMAKLGGSYCAKEYDPKADCRDCPNGSC